MEKYITKEGIEYNSFIYKWVDNLYQKYYIGSHVGSINDGYLFGGLDIKKEYNKRSNDFNREILSYHIIKEYKEIRDIEKEYLIKYDVENNESFYNRTNESYGGYHKKSVEKRLNDIDENGLNAFQRAAKKMVETRKLKNSYNTGKIKEYQTKKDNLDYINKKRSNTLVGSLWINKDGNIKYIKKHEYNNYILNGWCEGIIHNITYNMCSDMAKKLNIKSIKEWRKSAKLYKLPYNPDRKFKKEWIDWFSFLQKNR